MPPMVASFDRREHPYLPDLHRSPGPSSNLTPLIPSPRLDRPPPRRPHVSLEWRSAERDNARLLARWIPALKRDHACADFAWFDNGKPHRGRACNTQNRAVVDEHRGSPGRLPRSAIEHPSCAGRMRKIAHVRHLSPGALATLARIDTNNVAS
jgi:hypothetical protein